MSWLKKSWDISKLWGKKETSSSVAKQRLQMVLIHDRSDISPGVIEQIKDEIIEVIARRLSVDSDNVVVNLTQSASESRLVAEIPLQAGGVRNR